MKTSVVLSSYNGEKYIQEQLQSILCQTRQVDEVLIIDDMSKDSTTAVVESFIIENGLNNKWRLYVNKENKGWKRNFMDSFHKATGDIIFSCDQDDIWDKNKVANMVACFEKDNRIELLSSNFIPFFDKDGHRTYMSSGLTRRKMGANLNETLSRAQLTNCLLQTFVPGCTIAFRKTILEFVDMVWYPEWAHDSVLSTVAKLRGSYFFLNEDLLLYRRHEGTNTPKNVRTRQGRVQAAKEYFYRVNRLEKNAQGLGLSDIEVRKLKDIKTFLTSRIELFTSDISLKRLLNYMRYIDYYPSIYSWGGDLFIRLRDRE